jgi:hypothetical protein
MIKSRMRWVQHVASTGDEKCAKFWLESLSEGDQREVADIDEDNIKVDLREIQWESVDWISLAQDADQHRVPVSTVVGHWAPQKVENFLTDV